MGERVRKPLDIGHDERDDRTVDLDFEACYRAFRTRDARFDGRLSLLSDLLTAQLRDAAARRD